MKAQARRFPTILVSYSRHIEHMSGLADRAETIAARLVELGTGADVFRHDEGGRQGAVDFIMDWPDGRRGALEVTLVTEPRSAEWHGLAAQDGWNWPAATSWEFRPSSVTFPYRRTKNAVLRAVELCDLWRADGPDNLPIDALYSESELRWFLNDGIGTIRRTLSRPGVTVYQRTRTEFVEAAPSDFSYVIESWLDQSHMTQHIEKTRSAPNVDERHLFVVPVDDVLPARYFTDDFSTPTRPPTGYEGIDGLWVWSNYWHRYLWCRNRSWVWLDLPTTT